MSSYYKERPSRRRRLRRVLVVLAVLAVLIAIAAVMVRRVYYRNLLPVSNSDNATQFVISSGEPSRQISMALQQEGIVRSSTAFDWYVASHNVRAELQAGTYELRPSMSVPEIVNLFVKGRIAANLVTILPGQRLDQIRATFNKAGFNTSDVATALTASTYDGNPALVDNPDNASLEGFLFPDSFQKDSTTMPQTIVQESLAEMNQALTPGIRAAFVHEGLSVYQGVTLASIVEQEVSNDSDRAQAAQVFLSRLKLNMPLGSDVTAFYGALIASKTPSTTYDSPYNTLLHKGLPPGPISNVSTSSLNAVAHPANTQWLFFVSGDNGKTYFSKTAAEHDAQTAEFCHKLCSGAQ